MLELRRRPGLVVILHNDIDMPFGKGTSRPVTGTPSAAPAPSEGVDHLGDTGLGRIVGGSQVSADAAERHPTLLHILEAMLTDAHDSPT